VCLEPVATPAATLRPAADADTAQRTLRALTVLIVDDDPGAREVFTAVLGARGVRVLCAASAAEGLSLYMAERPGVLLIDIGMPGESGFMLLQHIRRHEAEAGLPTAPALAVTAYAGAIARTEVLEAGFAAHVPKPVLPSDLVAALHQAMNR
jgi:CheY-like chemotaxis protein